MTFDVSASKQALAFGDSEGCVHLWTDSPEPSFNPYSRETEFALPCLVDSLPPLDWSQDLLPLSLIPVPLTTDALLSDWPAANSAPAPRLYLTAGLEGAWWEMEAFSSLAVIPLLWVFLSALNAFSSSEPMGWEVHGWQPWPSSLALPWRPWLSSLALHWRPWPSSLALHCRPWPSSLALHGLQASTTRGCRDSSNHEEGGLHWLRSQPSHQAAQPGVFRGEPAVASYPLLVFVLFLNSKGLGCVCRIQKAMLVVPDP